MHVTMNGLCSANVRWRGRGQCGDARGWVRERIRQTQRLSERWRVCETEREGEIEKEK